MIQCLREVVIVQDVGPFISCSLALILLSTTVGSAIMDVI